MTGPFHRSYLLALKRMPERYLETMSHLKAHGLVPEIVFGLDGTITGLRTDHTYEVDHPGSDYHIGPRTISMHLSHMMMWTAALYQSQDADSFLFMEDDVRFDPDWRDQTDDALRHMPDNWDMIHIGACCVGDKHPKCVSGRLYKVDSAMCTHAYAVRRKALPFLLEKCQRIYAGVDLALALDCMPSLNCYTIFPRVANQHNTVIAP